MTPDFDLSNLHEDQAHLWFYLQTDAILADILADHPERRTSPLALGASTQGCITHYVCEAAFETQIRITGGRPIGVSLGNEKVN